MRTRFRLLPVAFALMAAVVLLAACGGSGGSGEDATKLLDQTFGSKAPIKSGTLGIAIAIDTGGAQGLNGPVNLKLAGPFESQGDKQLPKFDFTIGVDAAGQNLQLGAISTGDAGFVRFQGQDYALSPEVFASFKKGFEESQAQADKSKGNQTLATLGVDPRDWLKDAKVEGDETVAGTETIHVSAEIDVPKLLDGVNTVLAKAGSVTGQNQQVPRKLSDQQRKAAQDAIEKATFDVYTGKDDKILRKLVVDVDFKDSKGEKGKVEFSVTIGELNTPQSIQAPVNAKPLSDLTDALKGGGLGGLLGGAAGGAGSTDGGAPGNGDTVQAYTQCLQNAQGDITAQQACAKLLTP